MSSLDSKSSIPELINHIRYSFLESEFSEVKNILVGREESMRLEMENLVRECGLMKEKIRSLERRNGLVELEKIKLEERVKRNEGECHELKERLKRSDRECHELKERLNGDPELFKGKVEEECRKLREEKWKMLNDKDKVIFELMEKINELKKEKLESERSYEESVNALRVKLVQMEKEVEDLRHVNVAAEETVEELRRMQSEAHRKMNELRLEKLESDKVALENKKKFESFLPRIAMMEQTLATALNANVEDLANVANGMKASAAAQELEHENVRGVSDERQCSGNGRTQSVASTQPVEDADAETTFVLSPGVSSACNVPEDGCNGFSGKGLHASGLGSDGTLPVTQQLNPEARSSSKMTITHDAANIIEIIDSDDEGKEDASGHASNLHVNDAHEPVNFAGSPSSGPAYKRKRTGSKESFCMSSDPKRKRNTCEEKAGTSRTCQTPLQKLDKGNGGDSTNSEDGAYSDSFMDKLVASLQPQKNCGKWLFEADMLKAFEEDAELCMDAVCALYRQQILAEKPAQDSVCRTGGLSNIDALSVRALAEYLIDGDPELKLRKSVDEVRQSSPTVLRQCKRLAITYHAKLFEIYCNQDDPFSGRKSDILQPR